MSKSIGGWTRLGIAVSTPLAIFAGAAAYQAGHGFYSTVLIANIPVVVVFGIGNLIGWIMDGFRPSQKS